MSGQESGRFPSQQSGADSPLNLGSGSDGWTTPSSSNGSWWHLDEQESNYLDPNSTSFESYSSSIAPSSTFANDPRPRAQMPYDPISGRTARPLPSWGSANASESTQNNFQATNGHARHSPRQTTNSPESQRQRHNLPASLPPISSLASASSSASSSSSSLQQPVSGPSRAAVHPRFNGQPLPGRDMQGYVDLTADQSSPSRAQEIHKRQRDAEQSSEAGTPKRIKPSRPEADHLQDIEEIDLRDVDDELGLAAALQKQRADQVLAQNRKEGEAPRTLTSLQCVICMDVPTDLTITHCGHLFCYTCLMEALMAGERQSGGGSAPSRCPVCRTRVRRNPVGRAGKEVVPLELKVMKRSDYDKKRQETSTPPT
ncbi:hypothetical protein L228DRAFT_258098 [Xylona heveae TC161]|uniref:RING-type domain-containing protein n=1 Tax=Xylona heveae (strain CBS 132557 / TC161) TaxID=1328760 RepID=A0A165JWB6_XYLHT|nr:hypothetical protein L228DRAFT_258098 [Xylona heveae TC161]KZF26704.1 hypothetical protein L228DRAFT_258098 [Xylona heveae TC161]